MELLLPDKGRQNYVGLIRLSYVSLVTSGLLSQLKCGEFPIFKYPLLNEEEGQIVFCRTLSETFEAVIFKKRLWLAEGQLKPNFFFTKQPPNLGYNPSTEP